MNLSNEIISRRKVTAVTILTNLCGAILTFTYFAFIESALTPFPGGPDSTTRIYHFLAITGAVCAVMVLSSLRFWNPIWKELNKRPEEATPATIKRLVGRLLSLPLAMAVFSLAGWLASGILFGLVLEFMYRPHAETWYRFLRIFFGIVCVGAPFTIVFVYFLLERLLRNRIQKSLPAHLLDELPNSIRVNVLSKVILVSLLIGTIPVTIISFVTLAQIHEIHAGYQDIGSFINQMPTVIAFLLSLAVMAAIALSVFVARSVSEPLRQMGSAMERIRNGDLEAEIPVVSNDEIGVMAEGFNRMVTGLRERNFIRETFGSYLSPDVVGEILESPGGVNLGGELRDVTILVSDLRGFTALAASLPPHVVVVIINRYLEKMVDIIMQYGGTIDEFTGDGVLAFFGAPRRLTDSALRAVNCAIEMQRAMPLLNREIRTDTAALLSDAAAHADNRTAGAYELPELTMGIAISRGPVIVGNIGCERRKKYGAVGTPINMAFRLESKCPGGEILLTEEAYERVSHAVQAESRPGTRLKGIATPVTVYHVGFN